MKKRVKSKTPKKESKAPKKKSGIRRKSAKKIFYRRKRLSTKKTIKKIPTHIANFDKVIEGGFEKNSTKRVAGDAGAGKTIFATQFLIGGMERGEKCLFVTFEEEKEDFYRNMKRFGWDLYEYEKKGLFTFLEYAPIKVRTMLEEGGGTVESIILRKKISRIVIDSITSFALLFEDELEKREAALSLFNMISKWNCTALLTLEGRHKEEGEITSKTLEFESDSIILLHYLREKGERQRYIEVLKMRGTKHSKKMYTFNIEKKGITIGKKPVNIKLF